MATNPIVDSSKDHQTDDIASVAQRLKELQSLDPDAAAGIIQSIDNKIGQTKTRQRAEAIAALMSSADSASLDSINKALAAVSPK